MQRRSFLQSTTAAAAAVLPALGLAASRADGLVASPALALSLLSSDDGACFAPGSACAQATGAGRIRVAAIDGPSETTARFRVWFAGDDRPHAFEAASIAPTQGRSSPVRFSADLAHLVAIDATWSAPGVAPASAQCRTSSAGFGHLKPGSHWLVLHPEGISIDDPADPRALARLRLEVAAA